MAFEAAFEIVPTLDLVRANSVAPVVPWGLNPVAVGAIASSVSAVITASALLVALRTYLGNSRAAARSQAALVTARSTRSREIRIINGVEHRLVGIQIINYSDADIFELSLVLRTNERGVNLGNVQVDVSKSWTGGGDLSRNWGRWTLSDGAVVPPGVSTLWVFLNRDQRFSRIAVGFRDRNGREWTRWLDGELVQGWKKP